MTDFPSLLPSGSTMYQVATKGQALCSPPLGLGTEPTEPPSISLPPYLSLCLSLSAPSHTSPSLCPTFVSVSACLSVSVFLRLTWPEVPSLQGGMSGLWVVGAVSLWEPILQALR